MTICIAGIAEENKIIAITDKMLTLNAPVTTKFEVSSNDKAIKISNKVVGLFAGDVVQANEILARAKHKLDGKTDVLDIAIAVTEAYKEQWQAIITDHFLSRFGLTIDIFMSNHRNLDQEMVKNTTDLMGKFNIDVVVIVAGVDDDPHIYNIVSPGVMTCYDSIGYSCIGSGSQHAIFSLIESDYNHKMSNAKSVYSLIEAKKRAEYDPGVGQLCDLVIIDSEVKKCPLKSISAAINTITMLKKYEKQRIKTPLKYLWL